MKKMRFFLINFSIFIFLISCNSNNIKKENDNLRDSIEVEKNLLVLKNWTFKECFKYSELDLYKSKDIKYCDNSIIDLTEYYYSNNSDIDLNYIFEDINRKNLVKKWVEKKEYLPKINPPDFPEGSLNLVRALDFYNSEDLKKYIDSVRIIEFQKLR